MLSPLSLLNLALHSAPLVCLVHADEFLDTTVITASRFAEPLKETPVRTEVISEEVLQNRGLRSLAEAVEYSPGVRIETTCQNCNQQSIQMLGLPQQYIGILNDGMPNFSSLAGVYGIEQIPSALIGQIEIVKGGGSALYGPGAVAGVINLIPRDPEYTGGQINVRLQDTKGDSFGQEGSGNIFGLYDLVSEDEEVKLTLYAGRDRVAPIDRDGDGFTNVSLRNLVSGGARAAWTPNEEHSFSLDLFGSEEERRGGDTISFEQAANQARVAEEITSTRFVATVKWDAEWNEEWSSRAAYSYSQTQRDSYYGGTVALGSPDPTSPYYDATWTADRGYGETNDSLHVIDLLATWAPSEQNRFTFGTQLNHESVEDVQIAVNRQIDTSFSDLGFIAQHRYEQNESLTYEYGARVDIHSEVDTPIFSPRAAVLYSPNYDVRIRTAVSTGFRAPTVFNEDLHIDSVGGELSTTYNDPELKEESSVTVSISPEWQITDTWRVELNSFHTWLDDTLVVEPNDDPATTSVQEYERTNGESSRIYGAEFNLAYLADDWQLELSWVLQQLKYANPQLILGEDGNATDNAIYSDRYPRVAESLGLLKYTYFGEHFDFFVTGKITGPMDIPHVVSDASTGNLVRNELVESDWFFTVDLGLSREIEIPGGTLTATVGIQNLFDEFQDTLDTGVYADADFVYGPAFPRTFYAGLNYEF